MDTKICKECNKELDINDFNLYYKEQNKRRARCKYCLGFKNKQPLTKEEKLERNRNYKLKNKEKVLQEHKEYYERKKQDPIFLLKKRFRQRIYHYVNDNNKSKRTADILGCSYEEFKIYIESKFTEGMSWNKMGEIHIDHIIPLSIAETVEEVYKLSHYTNLQPLWAKDNLSKYNKLI